MGGRFWGKLSFRKRKVSPKPPSKETAWGGDFQGNTRREGGAGTSILRELLLKCGILRECAALLARHAVARTAAEKRRVGVAVMRFLRNVHFTCASFFRKPFLKWDFERTRRPAGTSCCCKDGGRKAAQWCCGYEISAERSFHMCVFLPQTVSEMGLRENAPPCWQAIAVAGTVAVGSGAPTFRS